MKAKAKLGDKNADIIAEVINIENYDKQNKKGLCPWHAENTPSFIYNPKTYNFHCFGCSHNTDIIDAYMHTGKTYLEALQNLFEKANIPYSFGEKGVRTKQQYRYPKLEPLNDKSKVYEYLGLRCISKQTIDNADVREDARGNIVFNFYDANDVLGLVKYRPSHRIDKSKGEIKSWCQKDADTSHLLFNMNRVNVNYPLLITEGEIETLAAIESGYKNAVSVPLGANNYGWIEENFEWLEQFDSIIICADNDEPGIKMQKECIFRLGSWRTKFIEIPRFHYDEETKTNIPMKDLNEVLYWKGKDGVLNLINNAKDTPVDSVADFSDIQDVDLDETDGIKIGIDALDRKLMKLFYGTFTIVTGINGCVDCDTEYFNGSQWKRIAEYKEGERVLQYNKDGTASLVMPEKYHKYPCDELYHFSSNYGVEQMVSSEHNLVYLTSKGNLAKKKVADVVKRHNETKNGFQCRFLTTFEYSEGVGIPLTDEQIRVMCAVICDGHFPTRKNVVPECRINIKKQRKKDRLEELLTNANILYRKKQYNPKDLEFNTYLFHAPIVTKEFDEIWYQCNTHQLQVISEEVLFWDGCISRGRKSFSTTNKKTADFIQFVFTACGYRSVVSSMPRENHKSIEYHVSITKQKYASIMNVKKKREIDIVKTKDGFKYCFTVNSGMLVLRRNGRINITGNSGKSSFLSQLMCNAIDDEKNAFLYSGELPNSQSKNWLNYVLAGQRHIKEYEFNNATYWKITPEAKKKMDEHYRQRLFIYKDGYDHKASSILKAMEDTTRKYGCKLHIIDNLTSVNLESSEQNKYQKQESFVTDLISFAKKFNVTVILVVHPHKIEQMRRLNKMDIQGISAIIDLAHRIISLYRVSDEDKKGVPKRSGDGWFKEPIKYDVLADILKDRLLGHEGASAGLYYDKPSRRFFTDSKTLDKQYGWDNQKYTSELPFLPRQLLEMNDEQEVYGVIAKDKR